MPRKKRRTIIIVSAILLLLVIATIFTLLYFTTDSFKSSSSLFTKYIGQNVENMDTIYQQIGTNEYDELLEQNKYTSKTQVKINYIQDRGTTVENTQNAINELKLEINGQTDNSNQYNYQDIQLLKKDEKIAQVEYIQNKDVYGIRFSDLFNQYILVNNQDLKELLKKAGYAEEELVNIPDTIEINHDFKDIFQFSEEEKQNMQMKYINIINSNISKDSFSKKKNQVIQIDGRNISANAYILTLTKEQMNNLYIKILEQAKQDEIILGRMDNIQDLLEKYQVNETKSLREQFVREIENSISHITRNNIGQDEAKIIVYENNQTTVRTILQNLDYEISIDILPLESENYLQIGYRDKKEEQVVTYRKTNEEASISIKNTENEKTTEYSLLKNETINNNKVAKTIIAKYEDDTNKVETTVEQQINIVNNFGQQIVFKEDNSINLNTLEQNQLKSIIKQISDGVSEKVTQVATEVNMEDLMDVLKAIGLVKEGQVFESTGISETEKNRFNSKFEILQGENLGSTEVLNLIDAIKENFVDIEVLSNTQLKLKLDQFNKNEEVVKTLNTFIEENKNKQYDAKVEYDEGTGLVSGIVLTMLER